MFSYRQIYCACIKMFFRYILFSKLSNNTEKHKISLKISTFLCWSCGTGCGILSYRKDQATAWHVSCFSLWTKTILVTLTTNPYTWPLRASCNRRSAKRHGAPGLVHCRGCDVSVHLAPLCTPKIDYGVKPAPDLKQEATLSARKL